jgi:protein-tyrosine phosphatase
MPLTIPGIGPQSGKIASCLMVDIHCHILPEVDDGASSWEIAEEMCRMAAADGIEHIVATPHANYEYPYDREQNAAALERLRGLLGDSVSLSLGCDFHLSYDNVTDALAHPERYTIEGGGYLLIELSDYSIPPTWADTLLQLCQAGLRPVLTHPERNALLQMRPEDILQWAEAGCIMQVTANSLTGRWGERALRVAQMMLSHDAVHVIASDAHDTRDRPPILSLARDAVAHWLDPELARILVDDNPRAMVEGKELPYFPRPILIQK